MIMSLKTHDGELELRQVLQELGAVGALEFVCVQTPRQRHLLLQ